MPMHQNFWKMPEKNGNRIIKKSVIENDKRMRTVLELMTRLRRGGKHFMRMIPSVWFGGRRRRIIWWWGVLRGRRILGRGGLVRWWRILGWFVILWWVILRWIWWWRFRLVRGGLRYTALGAPGMMIVLCFSKNSGRVWGGIGARHAEEWCVGRWGDLRLRPHFGLGGSLYSRRWGRAHALRGTTWNMWSRSS